MIDSLSPIVMGNADVSSGYMSEGGITVYARKMQARFKEGLEAVRDSMRHRHHDFNDRSVSFYRIFNSLWRTDVMYTTVARCEFGNIADIATLFSFENMLGFLFTSSPGISRVLSRGSCSKIS
ncbi:unnamed protein product [Gongylonema pulchrum]|uniref:ABC transmembrane type-1 domain-containing protein n=1 Tax=Gongylonema pulchrum TaxID=637853 RepID=A0A183EVN1_9BILA|nr:unnamed protein product [Gongylonema pulchrum]